MSREPKEKVTREKIDPSKMVDDQADLLALFRLLMKEPPRGHDFRTCLICQRHGITTI